MDKALIKKADRLWQIAIISAGRCGACGKRENLVGHHWFFGKKAGGFNFRWDLDNGLCLCTSCHFTFHSKESGAILSRWISRQPKEHEARSKRIEKKHRAVQGKKMKEAELLQIIQELGAWAE